MRIILILVSCFMALSANAQIFSELIQSGDKLYKQGNYIESAKEYEKAFEIEKGNADQYYNAACSWALAKDTIQAIKYLNLSIKQGWHNLKHIQRDNDLISLHSINGWDSILSKVQFNLSEYEKNFDTSLKAQLDKIYLRDQTLRLLYRDAEEKFGDDSEEMKFFWKLVLEQDSINVQEIIEIIDKNGWVGKSLVGKKANMTIWLVIQHGTLEIQEKYLPLLRESVLKGESQARHLALLVDRIEMNKGKPQIYGSQIVVDKKTGKEILYKIWKPESVNQRRKEVGLGPIEDYVKSWGIEWRIEQKGE